MITRSYYMCSTYYYRNTSSNIWRPRWRPTYADPKPPGSGDNNDDVDGLLSEIDEEEEQKEEE